MKNFLNFLKIAGLSALAIGAVYAQGDTKGGTPPVNVPDSGASVVLLGIAAVGVLVFARNRLKK